MPTRLPVLLQRRKSAAAGCAWATTAVHDIAARNNARVTKRPRAGNRSNSTLMRPGSCPTGGISREASGSVNEDGPEVINIGESRPRHQKIPERGEEIGGIV